MEEEEREKIFKSLIKNAEEMIVGGSLYGKRIEIEDREGIIASLYVILHLGSQGGRLYYRDIFGLNLNTES